jgi:hypothetical protein
MDYSIVKILVLFLAWDMQKERAEDWVPPFNLKPPTHMNHPTAIDLSNCKMA